MPAGSALFIGDRAAVDDVVGALCPAGLGAGLDFFQVGGAARIAIGVQGLSCTKTEPLLDVVPTVTVELGAFVRVAQVARIGEIVVCGRVWVDRQLLR